MTRSFFPLSALVLLSMLSYNCDRQGLPEVPQFITTTGTYRLFGGQITVEAFEFQGDINYKITHGPDTAGPREAWVHKGRPWFIYPAGPNEVWTFDGDQKIVLIEFSGNRIKWMSNDVVPDLLQKAPAEVLGRLPKDLN